MPKDLLHPRPFVDLDPIIYIGRKFQFLQNVVGCTLAVLSTFTKYFIMPVGDIDFQLGANFHNRESKHHIILPVLLTVGSDLL